MDENPNPQSEGEAQGSSVPPISPASYPNEPPPAGETQEARTWNMVCHLAALAGVTSIPFANILGPLIVWLVKKDQIPSVDTHGKESMNFQISMTLYFLISAILILVGIGLLLIFAVIIFNLVCVIIAAVKANKGEPYQYPLTIRMIT